MIQDTTFRTITCDECGKTVTMSPATEQEIASKEENAWLRNIRAVARIPDKKNFVYCSDECEIEGIKRGQHNVPVIIPGNDALAKQAAAQAERARVAEAAVRSGAGGQITLG